MCVLVCVSVPRLLLTSSMMWCDTAVLWQLYVVGIVNGRGLSIDMRHGNQPNKSKLVLYKAVNSL